VSQFAFLTYGSHYDPFIAFIILTAAAVAVIFLSGPELTAGVRRGGAITDEP